MKTSISSHIALALVCAGSLLAPACAPAPNPMIATDTGNPYGDIDVGEATEGACDVVKADVALGDATALGFSPQAIADLVAGEQAITLEWLDASGVEYGPESGSSTLTLRVEPLGTAHLVDRSPASSSGSGGLVLAEPVDGCRDSLALDVRIQLETAGGALAESVETTVEAYAADFASSAFGIDLEGIGGSFEATVAAPANTEVTRARLVTQIGFSEYGAVGSLGLQSELRSLDGSAVGQGGGNALAHFPAEDYCGAPNAVSVLAEQAVRGLSLAAVLDGLNAQSPTTAQLTPSGSSQLELIFAADAPRVCISFDSDALFNGGAGGAVLRAAGSVRLHSEDGRIDGEIPVELSAQTLDGALQLNAEASQNSQEPAIAARLPALFAVRDPVNLTSYDGASARFRSHASDTDGAGGSLVISGLEVPECLTNPPPVLPGAMGSPGCSGIDEVPLWSASWGTPQ